jgi:hypothetical protein
MMTNGLKGAQHWTAKNTIKIRNLSRVLLEIGSADNTNSPTFIACSEIENRGVLEDLIKQPKLIQRIMASFILTLPIKRELMLLYQRKYFRPPYTNIPLYVYKKGKLKHRL